MESDSQNTEVVPSLNGYARSRMLGKGEVSNSMEGLCPVVHRAGSAHRLTCPSLFPATQTPSFTDALRVLAGMRCPNFPTAQQHP